MQPLEVSTRLSTKRTPRATPPTIPEDKIQKAIERRRLQELFQRPTTSPRETLAQKQLMNQLQQRNSQYELYKSKTVLVMSKMTIQDIMSLRKGPFTTAPFQMLDIDLRGITHLELALLPFGEAKVVTVPRMEADPDSKLIQSSFLT